MARVEEWLIAVFGVIRRDGGYAPRPRRRAARTLQSAEREEISRGLAARQYFPKGQDVSGYSQVELNRIARRLNERPRETLNWLTPLE